MMTTTTTCELEIRKDDCDHISPGPVTHFYFIYFCQFPPGHLAFCDCIRNCVGIVPTTMFVFRLKVSED